MCHGGTGAALGSDKENRELERDALGLLGNKEGKGGSGRRPAYGDDALGNSSVIEIVPIMKVVGPWANMYVMLSSFPLDIVK